MSSKRDGKFHQNDQLYLDNTISFDESIDMGNLTSFFSADDPIQDLDTWKIKIQQYMEINSENFDPQVLLSQIFHVNTIVAKALVDAHPEVIESGFSFLTNLLMILNVHMQPLLISIIKLMINDTKCPRKQCILSLARMAALDITCVAECFQSYIALDGRLRRMYYYVLRSITEGSTILHLKVDAYGHLLLQIIELIEKSHGTLRDQITVVMDTALKSEKFPTVWNSHWDTATKQRCYAAMPASRRIAKMWAADTYPTSELRRNSNLNQGSSSNGAHRRSFSQFGRKGNDLDISDIPREEDPYISIESSVTAPLAPKVSSARPTTAKSNTPTKPLPSKPPTPIKVPHKPIAVVSIPWISKLIGSKWLQGNAIYCILLLSILFAIAGVLNGIIAFSQDYEAWRLRISLEDYQASIAKSEREVLHASWKIKEMTRQIQEISLPSDWNEDIIRSESMSAAWQEIQDQLQMP